MPQFKEIEWVFEVNVTITVNGEHLIKTTFTSSENYDDCHRKRESYIKKHTKEGDQVLTNINWTNHKEYPVTRYSTFD